VLRRNRQLPKANLSDAEVRDILVQAMADAGFDPAFVYSFQKTGIYICDENEKRLSKSVDEYFAALTRTRQ
jgi:hypothetical protein